MRKRVNFWPKNKLEISDTLDSNFRNLKKYGTFWLIELSSCIEAPFCCSHIAVIQERPLKCHSCVRTRINISGIEAGVSE
jgi:hypothetical protein